MLTCNSKYCESSLEERVLITRGYRIQLEQRVGRAKCCILRIAIEGTEYYIGRNR